MKTASFRLEILGSLTRKMAVVEKVEQIPSLDATALEKSAGHVVLKAVTRPAGEESGVDLGRGLGGRGWRILVVQEGGDVESRRVWRREGLERGNIWALVLP